jgi:hypothetical protein
MNVFSSVFSIIIVKNDNTFDKLITALRTAVDNTTQNGNVNRNKHLWIKKATGLGISEFMLRFMAWLCLRDNSPPHLWE